MVIGWEALIVLNDLRAAAGRAAADVSLGRPRPDRGSARTDLM
jgi:hypothetical protein